MLQNISESLDCTISHTSPDILVDMNGVWDHHRLGALVSKPAPIQVHWLAFPHSTTASFVDYFIADPIIIPPEARPFYTEHIVYPISTPTVFYVDLSTRVFHVNFFHVGC